MRFARKVQKYGDAFSKSSSIFFTTKGLAIRVLIPKGKPKNAKFCKNKVLRKIVKLLLNRQSKTGTCGIYFLHYNALSHKAGSMT